MKRQGGVFLFIAVALSAGVASAGLSVDQSQLSATSYLAGFFQPNLAQSFQQDHSNIAGAGILMMRHVGTTDTVTIALWDGLPNAGGTRLASASGTATAGTWFDVFWSPVNVTPGDTLFLVFTSGQNTLGIVGDEDNLYAHGIAYANAGYQAFPGFDYTFRTYYDDAVTPKVPVPAVPAPAALLLGALGTGVVAWLRGRKTL